MLNASGELKLSILILLIVGYIIYDMKPKFMFKENGEFKQFCLNKDETVFSFFIVLSVIGFTTYYGLLIKQGKYV